MESVVYFVKSRAQQNMSPAEKFDALVRSVGLDFLKQNDLVAVKIHFGEIGATGYLHPTFARTLIATLKRQKVRPFLTDTNTLYHGPRSNGIDHYELAIRNGFGYEVTGAPIVIADGVRSGSSKEIPAGPNYFKTVKIGAAVWEADALITMNHFKAHLVSSFGGSIKNLSMGCASRATKQRMHADLKPAVNSKFCIGCGECSFICPVSAIKMSSKAIPEFNSKICIGCAECLSVCKQNAIKIQWSGSSRSVQEKMSEVALSVVKHFQSRCLHFNFLLNITPECDCMRWTDNPFVQDIGILASTDPVAIDQASYDLVNAQPGLHDCALPDGVASGTDKFAMIHPDIDPVAQLEYGEKIGLGSREYRLQEIVLQK